MNNGPGTDRNDQKTKKTTNPTFFFIYKSLKCKNNNLLQGDYMSETEEVIAKFRLCAVRTADSYDKEHPIQYTLDFYPVCEGSPENKEFFKWTPSGLINLCSINEKAAAFFIPDKEQMAKLTQQEFYVIFRKAPKQPPQNT